MTQNQTIKNLNYSQLGEIHFSPLVIFLLSQENSTACSHHPLIKTQLRLSNCQLEDDDLLLIYTWQ